MKNSLNLASSCAPKGRDGHAEKGSCTGAGSRGHGCARNIVDARPKTQDDADSAKTATRARAQRNAKNDSRARATPPPPSARDMPRCMGAHRVERAHEVALLRRQLAFMLRHRGRARAVWRAISCAQRRARARQTRDTRSKRAARLLARARASAVAPPRAVLIQGTVAHWARNTARALQRRARRRTGGGVWQLLQELLQLLVAQELSRPGAARRDGVRCALCRREQTRVARPPGCGAPAASRQARA